MTACGTLSVPCLQVPLDAVPTECVPTLGDDCVLCANLADLTPHPQAQVLIDTGAAIGVEVLDPGLNSLQRKAWESTY